MWWLQARLRLVLLVLLLLLEQVVQARRESPGRQSLTPAGRPELGLRLEQEPGPEPEPGLQRGPGWGTSDLREER